MKPNPTKPKKNRSVLKLIPFPEYPKKKKEMRGLCSDPLALRTMLGESTMKGSSSKTHFTDTASKKTKRNLRIPPRNPFFFFFEFLNFFVMKCLRWLVSTYNAYLSYTIFGLIFI